MRFTNEQTERLTQWSSIYGWSPEKVTEAAQSDETLRQLLEVEMTEGVVSDQARAIRQQITRIESCHHNFIQNVDRILQMIGEMLPSPVLGCGETDPDLAGKLRTTMASISAWVDGNGQEAGSLTEVLGERTSAKQWLAACLCKTLAKQLEGIQGDQPLPEPVWPAE